MYNDGGIFRCEEKKEREGGERDVPDFFDGEEKDKRGRKGFG